METARDQALGVPARVQRHMTTSILVHSPSLPVTGLSRDMLRVTVPLNERLFEQSLTLRDGVWKYATCFLISEAVRSVHSHEVACVFKDEEERLPALPVIKRLDYKHKSSIYQLGAIFCNEGTVEGTYAVHEDIFLKQFGYSPEGEKNDFATRLWLVWGDQKTAELIRSVKKEQELTASRDFERRDWMVGPPAYFHILQALTYMIMRTHFSGPAGARDPVHNLFHDISLWNRVGINQDNAKYHLMEPLIRASWNARILALFYGELAERGYLRGQVRDMASLPAHEQRRETYSRVIAALQPAQYLEILGSIRRKAFTLSAWRGHFDPAGEFTTMCRFLQEAELFLLFRNAVKYGDVGFIDRLIEPLAILFYGSDQHRYGYEMIHLRWLLSPGVSDRDLRESLLGSGLVNVRGRPDTFKAIDLVLEHINCSYKLDMRNFRNSTHDTTSTFETVALTSDFNIKLRAAIEGVFGEGLNDEHRTRTLSHDIFSLAMVLWTNGRCAPPTRPANRQPPRDEAPVSPDILTVGSELAVAKIAEFNENMMSGEGTEASMSVTDESSIPRDELAFCDITKFAEVTEHRFNTDSDLEDFNDLVEELDL
jgi:hypothetical protein